MSLTPRDVRGLPNSDPDYHMIFAQAVGLEEDATEVDDEGTIALFDECAPRFTWIWANAQATFVQNCTARGRSRRV